MRQLIRPMLLVTTATLALAGPAAAQEAASATASPEAATLDPIADSNVQTLDSAATAADGDIVVTARRRAESLKDVPIAVTAYSGEQLARQGALDISDIADTTPNVTLETSRGTNSTLTAFIRGVGQQDPVAGFEQGVGIYLDDVYLNRPQGALLDVYDVERIEVLRGPQGTLYGRNTIGGAVKYVTRRLATIPQASVRANIGTYGQKDLVARTSLPLTDMFRVGAAVARLTRNGFGDNLTTGAENYDKDLWATRGTVEFEPADGFFLRLAGDYTWDDSAPRGGHRLIPGLLSGAPILRDVFDSRGGLVLPKQKITGGGITLSGEAALTEELTLRSITAWRKDKSRTPIDFDALPAVDVDVPAIYRNKQFSQEVQLLLDTGPLNALLGGYFLKANSDNIFDVVLGTTGTLLGLPGFTASTFGDVDTRTWALFGDVTYDFGSMFSASVGGRYTSDRRQAVVLRRNVLNGPVPELGGAGTVLATTSNFAGEKTFKQFTPRASISFKPDADNTLYLSWSKGFKGGGFDPRGVSTAAPDLNGNGTREADEIFDYFLFDPEKVTSWEAGYKASLFDRRLNLALALFAARYRDAQVPGSAGAVINGVPTFVGVTTNAGKARFKGLELETSAILARDFAGAGSRISVGGSIGYIDAKYREFITNVSAFTATGAPSPTTPNGPVDVADFRKVQNTPKWSNSATADFTVPAGPGRLSANASLSYKSKTNQFETPSPLLDQRRYSLLDANLIYTVDRFTIGLHGKNLTDQRYITSGYQFLTVNPVTGQPILSAAATSPNLGRPGIVPSLGREGVVTCYYGSPRQLFVSLEVKF